MLLSILRKKTEERTFGHHHRIAVGYGRCLGILSILASLLWLAGCQSSFQQPRPNETQDPFDSQTKEMRQEVGRVKHQNPSSGVVYGGMSNEAKAIEDSLYGK